MPDGSPHSLSFPFHKVNYWFLAIGFAGVIGVTYLVGVGLGTIARGEPALLPVVSEPLLFPILFVLTPPILAAVNTLHGGNVASSLVIGLIPGLMFPVLSILASLFGIGNGDAPAWGLSLFYGGIGFLGALSGVVVAIVARQLYQWTM